LTRRWQMYSLQNGREKLLLEEKLLETGVTPKGFLYPTKMRLDQNGTTWFYLVFPKEFDASVFDPQNKHPVNGP
jgi:hypothetical protein